MKRNRGNSQQRIVFHQVIQPGDEQTKYHSHTTQNKGCRIAQKYPDKKRDKHQQNHQIGTHKSFSFHGRVDPADEFDCALKQEKADAKKHNGFKRINDGLPVALHRSFLELE